MGTNKLALCKFFEQLGIFNSNSCVSAFNNISSSLRKLLGILLNRVYCSIETAFSMHKNTAILTFILFLLLAQVGFSQKTVIAPTHQLTISGLVEKPVTITYSDILKEAIVPIGNITITNHLGAFKKEYHNVKGVLLLPLLKKVSIVADNPKLLSEYYFVFRASDGYSVVVSWNELFNTEIGNSFYLVVAANDQPQIEAPEKILLIATKDIVTGRRHIKGLQSIEVKRI